MRTLTSLGIVLAFYSVIFLIKGEQLVPTTTGGYLLLVLLTTIFVIATNHYLKDSNPPTKN